MYSAAIQRYFNEHIHLPYSFFLQPQRFIRHALKKKGAFMATAYNYVEPSEADNEDIIEYLATDFDVMAGNTAGRLCVLMKLPEPTMPLHCKMIGCSIKRDGSNPIWRTIELTEQGTLLLCGWGEGHTHLWSVSSAAMINQLSPESGFLPEAFPSRSESRASRMPWKNSKGKQITKLLSIPSSSCLPGLFGPA